MDILSLLIKYRDRVGFIELSKIFYRFKPIWLAFKKDSFNQLRHIINRIRNLAKQYHEPMKEDYLNSITMMIDHDEVICDNTICDELSKVNVFRKIRLAYSLKYRSTNPNSILYKIRNGKSYATDLNHLSYRKDKYEQTLQTVLESIIVDNIKNKVKNKKIYIPDYIEYTLPATEKQFTGCFPNGTCITIPKDMVMGVHWTNTESSRVDLDLSMIEHKGKIGWDGLYRTNERDILFSGDITDAPAPNGATELFYVKNLNDHETIVMLNYYNHDENSENEVPFKIVVAKQQGIDEDHKYMIDPNNVICTTKSKIANREKMIGLLITNENECQFYFSETYIGNTITSSEKDYIKHARQYLIDYHTNMITLKDILVLAGADLVDDKKECDIDLSPENLEKDTILSLIT